MASALEMLNTDGKKEHYMMKNLPNFLLSLQQRVLKDGSDIYIVSITIQKCMSVKYEIAYTLNMLSRVSKGYHDMNGGPCCAQFDETTFS